MPKQIRELFEGLRLRWICKRLGFERVILKNRKLRCYFVMDAQSSFYETETFQNLLQFVATKGAKFGISLKKSNKHLFVVRDNIKSLKQAKIVLEKLKEGIGVPA